MNSSGVYFAPAKHLLRCLTTERRYRYLERIAFLHKNGYAPDNKLEALAPGK